MHVLILGGTRFNVTGEPVPFGRLLAECVAGTGSRDTDLQWVPTVRLLAETIRDTLAWDLAPGGPAPSDEGLSREREEDLLRQLAGSP